MRKLISLFLCSMFLISFSHQVNALTQQELDEAEVRFKTELKELEDSSGVKFKSGLSVIIQNILERRASTVEDGIYRIDIPIMVRSCRRSSCFGTYQGTNFVFEMIGFNDLLQGSYYESYQFHRAYVSNGRINIIKLTGKMNEY